jgi:hypothetical protein
MDQCGRSATGRDGRTTTELEAHSRRRDLVRRGALGGAALALGGALFGRRLDAADAAPSKSQDERIFNFALLLEYLQAQFYTDGLSKAGLRGEVRSFAEIVSEHEREHVAFLQKALGPKARAKPTFNFGNAMSDQKSFVATAVNLENLGVSAYNGQAANLTKPALAAAVEIVSVEGRHAAWISDLAGQPPAPRAADPGASGAAVVAALNRTGFLKR